MNHTYGPHPRKEDARFIRGQGTFVDDITLPGMLHGAILRSPLAHARITSIDTAAASAHPKVVAVLTGADLAEREMAWMPTLFGDVQAVLATDKVLFQGQEVAFVVATDRYAARDALELIMVDYEPLPPLIDARKALGADAPIVRENLPGGNRIFDWSAGDKSAADAAFAAADVVVECDMLYPRSHPSPLETCGAIASYDATGGKATATSGRRNEPDSLPPSLGASHPVVDAARRNRRFSASEPTGQGVEDVWLFGAGLGVRRRMHAVRRHSGPGGRPRAGDRTGGG